MKNLLLLTAGALIAVSASAQKIKETQVPTAVKSAFQEKYALVKEVKWEKEGANYEANFEQKEVEQSVVFEANGSLVETELEIEISALPAKVMAYVNSNYAGQKIKEAAKITSAKGLVSYEVEIKGKDLMFDTEGKLLSK